MSIIKKVPELTYKYVGDSITVNGLTHIDIQYQFANYDLINKLFKKDPKKATFLKFLDKRYIGVILFKDDKWITHSWMTTPNTSLPPHLPFTLKKLQSYWLFYSHTINEYRGNGLYKVSLQILINKAYEIEGNRTVIIFADTEANNIGPRHTLLSLGFKPCGVIDRYYFNLPKMRKVNWGTWNKNTFHPDF
ncbi:MAG: hypothetical protein GX306_03290 [Clostridiales bacterium]|nr:hypothetical protein [Clostridiales bacterium]